MFLSGIIQSPSTTLIEQLKLCNQQYELRLLLCTLRKPDIILHLLQVNIYFNIKFLNRIKAFKSLHQL